MRLIQSVKRNLQQIKPRCSLSDKVLRNLFIVIEGTINSRPLTHVPADDPEAPVRTPNHFIMDSSSGLRPATLLDDSTVTLKRSLRTFKWTRTSSGSAEFAIIYRTSQGVRDGSAKSRRSRWATLWSLWIQSICETAGPRAASSP